jgi:hypothetical protein
MAEIFNQNLGLRVSEDRVGLEIYRVDLIMDLGFELVNDEFNT